MSFIIYETWREIKMIFYNESVKKNNYQNFGRRFVSEMLMPQLLELENEYEEAKHDKDFLKDLSHYLKQYIGRPTPLYEAKNLTSYLGRGRIFLKREDLNHIGSHKINNAIGQALLAKRMGKKYIVAETGSGQHGVATATACSLLGLNCLVFMGKNDAKHQNLNIWRMEILGAKIKKVTQGNGTLNEAVNEAMRYWVNHAESTHYILGSVVGPKPFPQIGRDFQSVIGKETRKQFYNQTKKMPNNVIASIGGGSNAIGMFYSFLEDESVRLYGIEAAGKGLKTAENAAALSLGKIGILHGAMTKLLQSSSGQVQKTSSIASGLNYPGVGPELSYLSDIGRVNYSAITDEEAIEAFQLLSRLEGIIPSLESAHAIAYAIKLISRTSINQSTIICLSGRGDKDVLKVKKILEGRINGKKENG